MFCKSCGSALQETKNTSRRAPNQVNGRKLNIKTSLLATTSLMTAVLLGLVVLPNVFKPAESINFEEIKLSVGESAYTWAGTYPQFKVVLQSKEAKYNDVALHLEKQDSKGVWSSVAVKEVLTPGVIGLTGQMLSKEGKVMYRASVFQGERLVDSSEVKKVTFIPKKPNFTYVGRIGYRFFSQEEYYKSPCPGVNGCWGFHIVTRAKVSVEIKVMNAGKKVSKTVKVEIPTINKVRVVKVSSFSPTAASGYFDHSEKLLTAKDLKRIALDWKKKQQQNKPTPTPTKKPQNLSASAQQCSDWRYELSTDQATIESWKPSDWYSWQDWNEQAALSHFLNSGDIGRAANVASIFQNVDILRQLINSRC
jgi:hypothetical protein